MGVYIKGMKMPKNCYSCNFCQYYAEPNQGCYCVALFADLHRTNFVKERLVNCPLVEAPTPHGRLIDADALKEHFPHDEDWDYPVNTHSLVCETIDNAPTIIESEGEE